MKFKSIPVHFMKLAPTSRILGAADILSAFAAVFSAGQANIEKNMQNIC